MCGICGKYNFKNNRPVDKGILTRMTQIMFYRGPDDIGFHLENNLGLGFRRLSIIDLRKGHQPISNEDNSIWVILNGEVYNFQDLKSDLEKKGHTFKTSSDVEVVVHLYEEMGLDFVNPLNGMFSLAVWDKVNKKLILARDRIGIKPLYYAITEDGITFGSELKALIQDPTLKLDIEPQGISCYFSLNYVPSPHTIYKDINKLPPAHLLICDANGYKTIEYWDIDKRQDESMTLSNSTEMVRDSLFESVKRMLVSDVPIGVFLSGGIDSSAVAVIYSKLYNQQIRTFSIGFSEKSYNELDFARLIARKINSKHYELVLNPQIQDVLPRIVSYCDEPFADSSAVALYFLCQEAKNFVKVVLTGDGGDELFGGYPTYIADVLANYYRKLPGFFRKNVFAKAVGLLPVSYNKYGLDFKLKLFASFADMQPARAHGSWRSIFNKEQQHSLFNKDYYSTISGFNYLDIYDRLFSQTNSLDELNRFMYLDLKAYLPEDMLVKVDRMSMANSLEVRVPFLDHTLVETAFRIPSQFKIRRFKTKYILRSAFNSFLPNKISVRKKGGFNIPVATWVTGPLMQMARDVLSSQKIKRQGIFNSDYINKLLKEHYLRKCDNSYRLWNLLIFFLWYLEFLERRTEI